MRLGHGLSLLSERVDEGSWTLPLEIGWIPPESNPNPGFGRPRVRGRKIKLNDARMLPQRDAKEEWELENDGRIEVSRWDDVRMRKWLGQRLVLYRVIECRADGKPRYKRLLWLIFVPVTVDAERPTPREAQAMYEERFGVEHSIRFMKGDLGLTCGQFNSTEAEGRVQVWVEMAATGFWFFWALRALAETGREKLPGWWRRGKLTPGAVRRLAAGLLLSLGWSKPQPKPRGKSSGRVVGTRFEPRKRFKAYRSVSR